MIWVSAVMELAMRVVNDPWHGSAVAVIALLLVSAIATRSTPLAAVTAGLPPIFNRLILGVFVTWVLSAVVSADCPVARTTRSVPASLVPLLTDTVVPFHWRLLTVTVPVTDVTVRRFPATSSEHGEVCAVV